MRPVSGLTFQPGHLVTRPGFGNGATYSWIEQPAADTVESPDIRHQAEPEHNGNEHEIGRVWQWKGATRGGGRCRRVCDLGASEGKEKEQEGSYKFPQTCHDVVGQSRGVAQHGKPLVRRRPARVRGIGEHAMSSQAAHIAGVECGNLISSVSMFVVVGGC